MISRYHPVHRRAPHRQPTTIEASTKTHRASDTHPRAPATRCIHHLHQTELAPNPVRPTRFTTIRRTHDPTRPSSTLSHSRPHPAMSGPSASVRRERTSAMYDHSLHDHPSPGRGRPCITSIDQHDPVPSQRSTVSAAPVTPRHATGPGPRRLLSRRHTSSRKQIRTGRRSGETAVQAPATKQQRHRQGQHNATMKAMDRRRRTTSPATHRRHVGHQRSTVSPARVTPRHATDPVLVDSTHEGTHRVGSNSQRTSIRRDRSASTGNEPTDPSSRSAPRDDEGHGSKPTHDVTGNASTSCRSQAAFIATVNS